MAQPRVSLLLLFGGESTEHEVSINSAKNIYASIDKDRYDISLGYISRDGTGWNLVDSFEVLDGPVLTPNLGMKSFTVGAKELKIDVIVPILHGKHGEDGEVQGLASLLHVPCVGPSLAGAAVSMDKDLTKRLLRDAKIPVVDWQVWHVTDPVPEYKEMCAKFGENLFVKPSNAGSSIGVSKVGNEDEFAAALTLAASYDHIVLIERAIEGREIELAVLGNDEVSVSSPGEVVAEDTFYSYDAKYAATSRARVEIPARLDEEVVDRLKSYAESAYRAVRGHGMARIDFFVTKNNEIFLNEINSIPGFTDISMYPKLWRYEGVEYGELMDQLISLAFKRS